LDYNILQDIFNRGNQSPPLPQPTPNNSVEPIEIDETFDNDMAVPINEVMAVIPEFNGTLNNLTGYVKNMDDLWAMINEYTEVEKLRFSFSARSKLKNQALDAIRDLEQNSWPEIKNY